MSATLDMIARDNPLAAVRRAQERAAADEARFQLARLAAVDMSREPPEKRALARNWIERLRELAKSKFVDIADGGGASSERLRLDPP